MTTDGGCGLRLALLRKHLALGHLTLGLYLHLALQGQLALGLGLSLNLTLQWHLVHCLNLSKCLS